MDSIRDDFYDKVGELSDSLPNNAVKIDPELEEAAAKQEFDSMRDNLKNSPTAQELSKTSPESFFKENFEPAGRDAYEQLDAKDEFLPLRSRVGNMDEDEVDRAVEFISKRPSIVGETVHDYLPYREKGSLGRFSPSPMPSQCLTGTCSVGYMMMWSDLTVVRRRTLPRTSLLTPLS